MGKTKISGMDPLAVADVVDADMVEIVHNGVNYKLPIKLFIELINTTSFGNWSFNRDEFLGDGGASILEYNNTTGVLDIGDGADELLFPSLTIESIDAADDTSAVIKGWVEGDISNNLNGFSFDYSAIDNKHSVVVGSDEVIEVFDDGSSDSIVGIGENKDITKIHNVFMFKSYAEGVPPISLIAGMAYFNTSTNKLMVYDGTAWQACW